MNRRLMMRKIRDVLRCHFEQGLSYDEIARAVGIAKGSVHNILQRFHYAELAWPLPAAMADSALERHLYPVQPQQDDELPRPEPAYIEQEIRRPHVTLELLWREYHTAYPEGMSRASFYRYCHAQRQPELSMKVVHKAGDKLFVDYSGDGLEYINPHTGELVKVELFVCCWGASSYCYAEATPSQRAEEFVASHVRALAYFGRAPHAVVPDNLRSAVKKSDRYEPELMPLYQKLAEHYGFAVLPARVRKPRDKAPVESAVGNVQRYIIARLRNRQCFSLAELNAAIRVELDAFNSEPMRAYGGMSRLERFLSLDQPAAQPLPDQPFTITAVQYQVRVAPNYHICFRKHYYSVPYQLVRRQVDVYVSGGLLEIYHDGQHVARHIMQPPNWGYTTLEEHMPPNHRFVRGWSPEWLISRGSLIGPQTAAVIREIFKRYKHPEQAYNSCMGVLNLARHYTPARLEAAAARALHFRTASYKSLKSILAQDLDQLPPEKSPDEPCRLPLHDNLRGASYYQEKGN